MSPVVSKRIIKAILEVLEGPNAPMPREPYIIYELNAALKTKKFVKLARARKATKKEQAQSEWAQIRAAVLKRSMGGCDHCNAGHRRVQSGNAEIGLSVDHMFGGSGRRRTLESVYTCWALCAECHRQKTNNWPSADYWLEQFIEHCSRCSDIPASQYDVPGMAGYVHAASIAQRRLDSIRISEALPHGRAK